MYYANGDIFSGEWVNDRATGKGVLKYANGCIYDGHWLDDKVLYLYYILLIFSEMALEYSYLRTDLDTKVVVVVVTLRHNQVIGVMAVKRGKVHCISLMDRVMMESGRMVEYSEQVRRR